MVSIHLNRSILLRMALPWPGMLASQAVVWARSVRPTFRKQHIRPSVTSDSTRYPFPCIYLPGMDQFVGEPLYTQSGKLRNQNRLATYAPVMARHVAALIVWLAVIGLLVQNTCECET